MTSERFNNIHAVWNKSMLFAYAMAWVKSDKRAQKEVLQAISLVHNMSYEFAYQALALEERDVAEKIAQELESWDEYIEYLDYIERKNPKLLEVLYSGDFFDSYLAQRL